ncbi:MAG: Tm-1-like ATP-binding domain-containing protein [Motiliproteus sp.]
MNKKPNVLLIATLDTKAEESLFIRRYLEEAGIQVHHLDTSIRSIVGAAEIGPQEVAAAAGQTLEEVRALKHEGKCQAVMIQGALKCAQRLHQEVGLNAIIGLGGSMGTTLSTIVMRSFPYGLPKVMISTMASGMTKPFVGAKDIIMVNPVCDISGLNSITREAFLNGAISTAAMAHHDLSTTEDRSSGDQKPLVAVSTLGTTDKCCVRVRDSLTKHGYEVMVFHTLGTGGEAMDAIIKERDVAAVVDLSLIEVSEHLHGGICAAGPDRCKAALQKGVPTIFAPGNLDFMVSGPIDVAKAHFPNRRYHIHNAALTAVRAEAEEFKNDAEHMAGLIKDAKGPVSFFVPLQGFSHHDSEEGYLHDPSLPPVFAQHLKENLPPETNLREFDLHINDAEFADALVEQVIAYTR